MENKMVVGRKRATPKVLILNVNAAWFLFRTEISMPVDNTAQGNGKKCKSDMLRIFEIGKKRRLRDRRFVISDRKETWLPAEALVVRNLFGLIADYAGFVQMQGTDREYCQE